MRSSNRSSEVAYDISSATDNATFKNRAQNIECCFGCVAGSTVLLMPNIANIVLFNFCERKPSLLIVTATICSFSKKKKKKKKITNLDKNPHQTVTCFWCFDFSMYACGFPVPSSEKMIIFAKIGIFYKSIASPLSEAKTIFIQRKDKIICQMS